MRALTHTIAGALILMGGLANAITAQRLRCEYLVDPIGIDTQRPRFSWELFSEKRGAKQTAYEIAVASSPELLLGGKPDIWNSSKVVSNATAQIEYSGPSLQSAKRYWWSVRAWDANDQPSEFAPVSFWEMGLLEKSDWHGKWIGARPADVRQYTSTPLMRTTFELNTSATHARAYICGLAYYELYINGERVGDRLLDPAYTDFENRVLYSTYDVTQYLRPGKNAVGIILGTGWYDVHTEAEWNFDKAPWRSAPEALLELRYQEGDTTQIVVTEESWKWSTGPTIFDSIYEGECYDARLEKDGWTAAEYDDSSWQKIVLQPEPKGALRAQQMPPIKQIQSFSPRRITQPQPGVFVFDFGQNLPGVPELSVNVPAGTRIEMKCGERLHPDGRLDQMDIAVYTVKRNPNNKFQTDIYIARGGGSETWQPRFTYHGFQYVEVTGYPGEMTADNMRAQVIHTAFEPVGSFSCSNVLLNRIQEATRWAYLSNAHGIPTDCPTREKNGWTGDAHLAAELAMFNFDGPAFYTKWCNDLEDAQTTEGGLPGIVPSGGWGYTRDIGPAWDMALFMIPWTMYQYCGDTRILETHYDAMTRYADWLTSQAKDGIIEFGLGDWCPYETTTPNSITSTACWFSDVTVLAHAAEILGKKEDSAKWKKLADEIRVSFNTKFFDHEKATYANGSQTALSCALYYDLVPDESKAPVFENLIKAVEARNWHIDTGILGSKYLLNVLSQYGRTDVAYRVAAQDDLPSWGWWILQGATTLWEQWKGTDSRNHIMFGEIGAWFYKSLAGISIDPLSPGFGRIIVKPGVGSGLKHAEAECHSIRGMYVSKWNRDGDKLTLHVEVPANCEAEVHLPVRDISTVKESDKPLDEADGVKISAEGVLSVGSGKYQFTCQIRQ